MCLAYLHQWSMLMGTYAADEDGRYPPGDTFDGSMRPGVIRYADIDTIKGHMFWQFYNDDDGSARWAEIQEMDAVWRIGCCEQYWVYR